MQFNSQQHPIAEKVLKRDWNLISHTDNAKRDAFGKSFYHENLWFQYFLIHEMGKKWKFLGVIYQSRIDYVDVISFAYNTLEPSISPCRAIFDTYSEFLVKFDIHRDFFLIYSTQKICTNVKSVYVFSLFIISYRNISVPFVKTDIV